MEPRVTLELAAKSNKNRTDAAPPTSVRARMRRRALPYDADVARKHIARADPVMRGIVKNVGAYEIEIRGAPYESLIRAILYQQLAGAAAAAIERRFLAIFGDRIPESHELIATSDEQLRTAGVSRQKAGYMHSLAEHFADGTLSDRHLRGASDDDVIMAVTQVNGIGRWTADMLLLFCLGRPDVLPVGDFGVRASMRKAYKLDDLPTPAQMEEIAEPWRPYRSAATWYLWRQTDIVTL